jgi:hypothetical protein
MSFILGCGEFNVTIEKNILPIPVILYEYEHDVFLIFVNKLLDIIGNDVAVVIEPYLIISEFLELLLFPKT